MLDWFTSSHRAGAGDDLLSGGEPPETPAHLFAVKAFKTAMWGTPAPYAERSVLAAVKTSTSAKSIGRAVGREQDDGDDKEEKENEIQSLKEENKPRHSDPFASPTKGILLTPRVGGSTAKRKSVSFGRMVEGAGKVQDIPQKKTEQQQDQRTEKSKEEIEKAAKEDLRRTLFQAKFEASQKRTEDNAEDKTKSTLQVSAQQSKSTTESAFIQPAKPSTAASSNQSPDVTVDLQAPRSQSGKHWKQEYERDHDASKVEMKKLIQYSQIAKSFAEKRDGDALRLTEKWKKAEAKVKEMESQVSDLAAQLMDARIQDEKQIELVNEVASQTARALRYKQKADRYRLALRSEMPLVESTDEELERRVGWVNDSEASGSEVARLQRAAQKAETRAEDVERENQELKKTLARVKEEMMKFEVRNKEREGRRKKKDEKAAAEKKQLEEDILRIDGRRKDLADSLDKANERMRDLQQELELARSATTDPAIDHIQLMRRRLRGLEKTNSRDSTITYTQEVADSPKTRERRQSRSLLKPTASPEPRFSSPGSKDHSQLDPTSPPSHSARRSQQSPSQNRPSSTAKSDFIVLSDNERDSLPLPGAENQHHRHHHELDHPKKSSRNPNSSSLISSSDLWTSAAAATTVPTHTSSRNDQRRPSLIPSHSADSAHRALSPLQNELLPTATTTSNNSRHNLKSKPQSQAIRDSQLGSKRNVSPLVPSSVSEARRASANVSMAAGEGLGEGEGKGVVEVEKRRSSLPPERAEAARRRLEAKMAERRGKGMNGSGSGEGESGKENEVPRA